MKYILVSKYTVLLFIINQNNKNNVNKYEYIFLYIKYKYKYFISYNKI